MTERVDFETAIRTQSAGLRTAHTSLSTALGTADLVPWRAGELVAVVAMGASTHSAEAFVAVLRRAGMRAVNLTASDFADAPHGLQAADHYVFVSESGRSPEPITVAERCTRGRRIAITNDPKSPLADVVDVVLPLGGFRDSRVYTTGYTATLLAYDLLIRRQLGDRYVSRAFDAAALAESILQTYADETADAARHLASVRAIDLAGRDVSRAAAEEGALVLREAARVHAAAYETYQYLHGPMESLDGDSAVIAFGDGREHAMVSTILAEGVRVLLVTGADSPGVVPDARLRVIRLPAEVSDLGRAIAEAVLMQLVAAELTAGRGIDIDEFRFNQPDTKIPAPAG